MAAKISNPLTVVAVFSGLAEAFATVALVNVPHDIQQLFVYFVMAFPTLIVLLFFAVLNWNPTVLYAPSDFEDQAMYLELLRLRGTLKSEILGTLTTPISGVTTLTPQQIQAVSEKVDRAIERVTVSPIKQGVLELLNEGPKTSSAIAESTGLSQLSVSRVLHTLHEEGMIVRSGSARSVMWSLPQTTKTDA